ncbi:MAG: hypothetical protein AB1563_04395, partial [Bacillota bacterium]
GGGAYVGGFFVDFARYRLMEKGALSVAPGYVHRSRTYLMNSRSSGDALSLILDRTTSLVMSKMLYET